MNYTAKTHYTNGKVNRLETSSIRRFLTHTRSINWQKSIRKVYLRVYYGKHKDVFGKTAQFINEGEYASKRDFDRSLKAFLEIRVDV